MAEQLEDPDRLGLALHLLRSHVGRRADDVVRAGQSGRLRQHGEAEIDDAGLAVVLGHEVAHAIAGHGNERMSQGLMAQMGAVALSAALSSQPAATQNLFMQAYGAGANVGLLLPYSRLHESEADRIGLVLMARAGYDPRTAVPFWNQMNASGGARPPELLSTHPAPGSRIAAINKALPEALRYYKP